MTFEEDLRDAMHQTAQDSPAPSAIVAKIQGATSRLEKRKRLAAIFAVAAAVAAIAIGATAQRVTAPSDVGVAGAPGASSQSGAASSLAAKPATTSEEQPSVPASSGQGSPSTTMIADPALVGSSARCYATSDVGRSDNYLSITIGGKEGSEPVAAGPVALQICSDNWRQGVLSTKAPYKIDRPAENASLPVPNLVACVLPADNSDEGVAEVAILPGLSHTCQKQGLAEFATPAMKTSPGN